MLLQEAKLQSRPVACVLRCIFSLGFHEEQREAGCALVAPSRHGTVGGHCEMGAELAPRTPADWRGGLRQRITRRSSSPSSRRVPPWAFPTDSSSVSLCVARHARVGQHFYVPNWKGFVCPCLLCTCLWFPRGASEKFPDDSNVARFCEHSS